MPRPALNRPYCCVEIPMHPEDKEAFKAWCAANQLTMAEVIRKEIAPMVSEGYMLT